MKLSALFVSLLLFTSVSIYTLSPQSVSGGAINFNQYQGKCMLITNIATGSVYAPQLAQLQQLYQQQNGNLVVIAFPSNSFGNEPRSNTQLASFLDSAYGVAFPVAAKCNVIDSTGPVDAVYQWLTKKSLNGTGSSLIEGDFQKYLINKQGRIVGIFDPATSPLNPAISQALQIHQ
jgi:glutathione peroxidase